MMKSLFKVVSQTEPTTINTKNGNGDLVWAALRFSHRENNGSLYQDIIIKDIVSFSNH